MEETPKTTEPTITELPDDDAVMSILKQNVRSEDGKWSQRRDILVLLRNACEDRKAHISLIGTDAFADVIISQLSDARSIIVRECCSFIGACSIVYGKQVERFCIAVLPRLFRLLGVATSIMAESASAAVTSICSGCATTQVFSVVRTASNDSSYRTRRRITQSICLSLGALQKGKVDGKHVEAFLLAKLQDADSEVRSTARKAVNEALPNSYGPQMIQSIVNKLGSREAERIGISGAVARKPSSEEPVETRVTSSAAPSLDSRTQ